MPHKKSLNQVCQAKKLVASIYDAVNQLGKLFPGRHFTPDGIMVGSLGEVLAEIEYNNNRESEYQNGSPKISSRVITFAAELGHGQARRG